MNSLDIFIFSRHYFFKKCMGMRKQNLYFDIGIKGLRHCYTLHASCLAVVF